MGAVRGLIAVIALIAAPATAADEVARWDPLIAEASQRFGVPTSWISRVMHAESRGRAQIDGRPIRSPKGAMGLMQLMPGTWTEIRARLGLGGNPDDPRDNILAGTFYLRQLYDRYGYPGLFAAYNAGPGRYEKYLSGTPLPAETVGYLAAVGNGGGAVGRSASPPLFVARPDVVMSDTPSKGSGVAVVDPLFAVRHDAH
ncbi:lytic transglycosylase domain-containing protein [Novosphingobium sp. RL4]|uniref:lytic transglycosylase domain-containing protein n=1 Tax=Novosphingobium sp. RL4 TaxID=3109595 RepID=UPI002D786694|nr:lytic transglycosylase domain-containing protein [Novosphingobium sp. RL4]WRT94485.1 lytic transglycosylase domain-containing protein [Novosphingobium sp. RL4]